MNNDIKEILAYMMQYVENKYEHDSEPMLNWKDIKCILDYITNLQEKYNKALNDLVKESHKNIKAIEKIKKIQYNANKYGVDHDVIVCQDLLNILEGNNNETTNEN